MKYCENCGAELEDSAVFCDECGARVETVPHEAVSFCWISSSDWKKGLIPFVPSRLITVPFSTTHQSVLVEPLSAMSIIS